MGSDNKTLGHPGGEPTASDARPRARPERELRLREWGLANSRLSFVLTKIPRGTEEAERLVRAVHAFVKALEPVSDGALERQDDAEQRNGMTKENVD